jgi:hypothetical protein
MGLLKTAVHKTLGPDSPSARRVLNTVHRIRHSRDPLMVPPVPWLAPDSSLLIVWSAKSACSLTYTWYLSHIGQLDDYLASGESPHEYRGKRYLNSDAFRRGRRRMLDDYRIVHILRDPYLRAISSYRHALATGFADKRFLALDPDVNRQSGFAFSQFLDFLDMLDPERWNAHYRQQLHPIERIKPADYVINISKVSYPGVLNDLEEELGLPRTDFGRFGQILKTEERRRAKTKAFARDVADQPLSAAAARGRGPWPDYEQFLTVPIRRRIERLYAADFEAFAPYL